AAHDRVVDLRFRLPRRDDGALERRLVVELLGRSANMLLLDAAGSILAFCRPLESAFRAPVVGAMYRPPPGREAYADLPPGAEAALGLIERLRDFQVLKAHYETLVRKEIGRLEELVRRLEQDLVQARRSEDHRRLGEALLAGLSSARVEGGIARVPDPYDPGGAMLEVLIDPARP